MSYEEVQSEYTPVEQKPDKKQENDPMETIERKWDVERLKKERGKEILL